MPTVAEILQHAAAFVRDDRLDPARSLCTMVLDQVPDQPDLLHLLGLIHHREQDHATARRLMRRAIDHATGRSALLHLNLGVVCKAMGRTDEAVEQYRLALSIDPECAEALCNLASALWQRGDVTECLAVSRQAVAAGPSLPQAHHNLANALKATGDLERAIRHYREALDLGATDPQTLTSLAGAQLSAGHVEACATTARAALDASPDDAPIARIYLGQAQVNQGRFDEAAASFDAALESPEGRAEALINLGALHTLTGAPREAMACYDRLVAIRPDDAPARSNALGTRLYLADVDPGELMQAHVSWGRRLEADAGAEPPHRFDRAIDRPLRIGYVSPDFRRHAVAMFIEPILEHHDARAVDVHCYAEVAAPDATTNRLRSYVPHWRNTCGLTDEQVAEQVRLDRIDILVDLAGHTANNRLGVFARRPAPIQVTYLGYPATTGLSRVDYRLTDRIAQPTIQPSLHVERLWRLPLGISCFRPPPDAPPVDPLSEAREPITFGSLAGAAKINDDVIDLWSLVLRRVENARLRLARDCFVGTVRDELIDRFRARGVDPSRLDIGPRAAGEQPLDSYRRIDVALDTFPYAGHTTTCEALWMGVPVVTLAGSTLASRMSASVLWQIDQEDWVAQHDGRFIEIAARLASVERSPDARRALRRRVADAGVCRPRPFTMALEEVYRRMWRSRLLRHIRRSRSRPRADHPQRLRTESALPEP